VAVKVYVPGMAHDGPGENVLLNAPLAEMVTVWVKTVTFTGFVIWREIVLPAADGVPVTVPEMVPVTLPT
jgi:hypothetical protein